MAEGGNANANPAGQNPQIVDDPPGEDDPNDQLGNEIYLMQVSLEDETDFDGIALHLVDTGLPSDLLNIMENVGDRMIAARIIFGMDVANLREEYLASMMRNKTLNLEELAFADPAHVYRIWNETFTERRKLVMSFKDGKQIAAARLECETPRQLAIFQLRKQMHIKPEILRHLAEKITDDTNTIETLEDFRTEYPNVALIGDTNVPFTHNTRTAQGIKAVQIEFEVIITNPAASSSSNVQSSTFHPGKQVTFGPPNMTSIDHFQTALNDTTIGSQSTSRIKLDPLKRHGGYIVEEKIPENQGLDTIAQFQKATAGLPAEQQNFATGFSAGMMVGQATKSTRTTSERKPVKYLDDLPILDYKPNFHGNTIDEILGPIYANASYKNPANFEKVRRMILKYVRGNRNSSEHTVHLCNDELFNCPPSIDNALERIHNSISSLGATSSLGSLSIFPTIGSNVTHSSSAPKRLKDAMGGEHLCYNEEGKRSLKLKLDSVSQTITSEQLSENCALLLIQSVSAGKLLTDLIKKLNGGLKLDAIWGWLEHVAKVRIDVNKVEEDLATLMKTAPTDLGDFNRKIYQIEGHCIELYNDIPNEESRRRTVSFHIEKHVKLYLQKHTTLAPEILRLHHEMARSPEVCALLADDYNSSQYLIRLAIEQADQFPFCVITSKKNIQTSEARLDQNSGNQNVQRGRGNGRGSRRGGQGMRSSFATGRGGFNQGWYQQDNTQQGGYRGNFRGNFRGRVFTNQNRDAPSSQPAQSEATDGASQRTQNYQGQNERRFNKNCHLCNIMGHHFKVCQKYPGQSPTNVQCLYCCGYHNGFCKLRRAREAQAQYQQENQRQQNEPRVGENLGNNGKQSYPADVRHEIEMNK